MGQPMRVLAGALHLLTGRAVREAGPGGHSDGGGLVLRVQVKAASWVFRSTAPSGNPREMGLGPARRSSAALALKALQEIRQRAQDCRNLLRDSIEPIDARDALRAEARAAAEAKKVQAARERVTLARAARDDHARVIEPKRTPKHAAQWIASLLQDRTTTTVHTGVARPHSACRSGSGLNEGLGSTVARLRVCAGTIGRPVGSVHDAGLGASHAEQTQELETEDGGEAAAHSDAGQGLRGCTRWLEAVDLLSRRSRAVPEAACAAGRNTGSAAAEARASQAAWS